MGLSRGAVYDEIGRGYRAGRREDPRIADASAGHAASTPAGRRRYRVLIARC